MIEGGGARIDGDAISDENALIDPRSDDVIISAGKKKHGLLRFS